MSGEDTPRGKRKIENTDLTPDKMPKFKLAKALEEAEATVVLNKFDLNYLRDTGKYIPKLVEGNTFDLTKTTPDEMLKELLMKGAFDDKLEFTTEDGSTNSLKSALMALKTAEDADQQPSFSPDISIKGSELDGNESSEELCEKLKKFMISDKTFKEQVRTANLQNSARISTTECNIVRKHFEDEQLKLYVTKLDLSTSTAKNGWELAQTAKQKTLDKITEVNRAEADKSLATSTLETVAKSKYLKLVRAVDSSKFEAMGKEAKLDAILGYKTIPLCITFASVEDKNTFKDSAKGLAVACKDSFPKIYNKQKETAMKTYSKSIQNAQGIWIKSDVRLGRPETPLLITIQTKKANTADRWVTKAQVKLLPTQTWGRMTDIEKEQNVNQGILS
jgi:hypothetical protein